ncbi:redoxin domain-containing protein [Haloechinothrix sp. LS1_15]|nr:redoxin domain-containing protein [Haloechinothrix sp. LS1_15]
MEVPDELTFTAESLDGTEIHGEAYAEGPAVFWFWTPWCTVCQSEAPSLAEAHADHGGEVEFVGVAADDELAAMQDFVSTYELGGFEHINDAERDVWTRFGVTSQPAYAFLDGDGDVDLVRGSVSEDELGDRLDALTSS